MIYLDLGGRGPGLIPAEQGLVPVTDRGLLYGDGLFETLLSREGDLPLLPLHLARLGRSAAALGIPCDTARVGEAAARVAGKAPGEAAIRITLTRGSGRRGYAPEPDSAPTLLITAAPYRRPAGPLTAITATVRTNPGSPLAGHKSLSALEKVLAAAEAHRAGVSEALLLNPQGRVAEGASTNLFLVRAGTWFTPPVSEGCLPGIMRSRLLQLTGAEERPVTPDELLAADGLYLTSALLGCKPLSMLNGRALPVGPAPPSLNVLLGEAG